MVKDQFLIHSSLLRQLTENHCLAVLSASHIPFIG
jgi:hypothetical protein